MKAADIRAYVTRDWDGAARRSQRYWALRVRARGAAEGIRVGYELWKQALAMHPQWPEPCARKRDLTNHVDLKQKLEHVGRAWARQTPRDPVGAAD